MDSRELLLGNLVLHHGTQAWVSGFDNNIGVVKTIQLNGSEFYSESEIEPLPLDEALLLKLGFSFDGKTYCFGDDFKLDEPINGSCSILSELPDKNLSAVIHKKINSVHELQNLLATLLLLKKI